MEELFFFFFVISFVFPFVSNKSLFLFLIRCEFCAQEVKTETPIYLVSNFEILFCLPRKK